MKIRRTVILILILSLVMTFSFTGMAFATTYTDTKGTITPEYGANLRSGAGTSYDVVIAVPKGTVVDVKESKKGSDGYTWYKVKHDGSTGWVRSDCISVKKPKTTENKESTETTYSSTKATITADEGVNARSGAGTSYDVVMTIAKNETVTVKSSKKGSDGYTWYKVKYNDKTGWVRGDLMKIKKSSSSSSSSSSNGIKKYTKTRAVVKGKPGVNMRKGPATSADIVKMLPTGTKVIVKKSRKGLKDDHTWYKVKYNGEEGWVMGKYIKVQKNTETKYSNTKGTVRVTSGANLRKGASMNFGIIEELPMGTKVTVKKSKIGSDGYLWYKVKHSGNYGWVRGTLLKITKTKGTSSGSSSTQASMTAAEYDQYLKDEGFPKSYRTLLKKLHKIHPDWVFKAAKTGLDWDFVVDKESKNGVSTVNYVYPLYYRSTEVGAYDKSTKKYTSYDSGGWYSASRVTIRHYLDPRNFLNEDGIYQFLTHSYDSATQTKSGLRKMVSGSFLENDYPKVDGENVSFKTYVDAIYKAGKVEGVNPYVIASIIIQEQGTQGRGGCISGNVKGYRGYYNFFNIGAYRSGGMSAVERGVWYASQDGSYGRPWNTRYKSIKGGAEFYAAEYVKTNKNTLYFKKWNVMNGADMVARYQYMSNTLGAAQEAYQLKKAYDSVGEMPLTFEIPVYRDMPSSLCPLPNANSPTCLAEEEALKVSEENEKIEKHINNISISGKSSKTKTSSGNDAISLKWSSDNDGYYLDYFEIYRSTKKNEGYKLIYTTKSGKARKYTNSSKLKDGTRYYYKIRGVRILTSYYGTKTEAYTEWSNIMSRIA